MTVHKAPSLEQSVIDFITGHRLIRPGQKVLVAISGGVDSVFLLQVLAKIKDKLGISLQAAHLNHQLRGAESDGDAAFVAGLAQQLKIPCTVAKQDVEGFRSKQKLTLEEAAREVRYTFLARTATATGADCVATAHNRNDQVETILLHLIRGTGTRGLQGLQPQQELRFGDTALTVIRPLLELPRIDIEAYCLANSLSFRQDSSNHSLDPLRNKVRLELLPVLQKYNSDFPAALLRLQRIAADEMSYLESETERTWEQVAAQKGPNIIFDKNAVLALAPALQRQLVRRAFHRLLGSLKDIETRHIEAVLQAFNKPAGRRIDLPGRLVCSVEYTRFILGLQVADLIPFPPLTSEYTLTVPGLTRLPGWQAECLFLSSGAYSDDPDSRASWANDGFTACFDAAAAGRELFIRKAQPGDSFRPLGLSQTKKVARFMIDARIPHDWRECIPLVCNPAQVLWVAGWRIDERAKVTAGSRSILQIKLTRQSL
jgi:tRNA(Ile)-lysidine synthase